jgi:hypothetical protein
MKITSKCIIVLFISFSTSYGTIIKKCCSSTERYNTETGSCVPNVNKVPYRINFMELTLTKQGWVSNLTSGIPFYIQKPEKCAGSLKSDSNYKVTQEGKLVNYIGANQSYYEFYNDFCTDVDFRSGTSIVSR